MRDVPDAPHGLEERLLLDGASVDWHLQDLVTLANQAEFQCQVALTVGSGVIRGRLISGRRYFQQFARPFSLLCNSAVRGEIYDTLLQRAELYRGPAMAAQPPPQFIHLEDAYDHAQALASSGSIEGGLWRGRINAVAGFQLIAAPSPLN